MATKKQIKNLESPAMQLQECIEQLQIINGNLFSLKIGVQNLIEAVEKGSLDQAKSVIEIFQLKQVLDNLTTKD